MKAILAELVQKGIKIKPFGSDKLWIGPKDKITDKIRQKVRQHKPELLKILQKAPQEPCYACGDYNWWLSIHGHWVCGTCHPPADEQLVVTFVRRKPPKEVNLEDVLVEDEEKIRAWLKSQGGYAVVKSKVLDDTIVLCLPEYKQKLQDKNFVTYDVNEILHLLVEKPSPEELRLIHYVKAECPGSTIYQLSRTEKVASRLFTEALKKLQKLYQPGLIERANKNLEIQYLQRQLDKTWLELLEGRSNLKKFKKALEQWFLGIREKMERLQ